MAIYADTGLHMLCGLMDLRTWEWEGIFCTCICRLKSVSVKQVGIVAVFPPLYRKQSVSPSLIFEASKKRGYV